MFNYKNTYYTFQNNLSAKRFLNAKLNNTVTTPLPRCYGNL
jgi:hypothetical protein